MSDPDPTGGERPAPADEPEPPPAICVDLAAEGPPLVELGWLRERFAAICGRLNADLKHLNLVVVDDVAMAALHKRFRGAAETTDVLSFDLRQDPAGSAAVDAEIYINQDEALRRSRSLGHAAGAELLLYATHGLLHLVGYDDSDLSSRQRMHAKEDDLLTAIGVGPVFAPARGAGR